MHEVFAAVRIWQLMFVQKLSNHGNVTGDRIFGTDRWVDCLKRARQYLEPREQLEELASSILMSSDWEDDTNDKNRNMHSFLLCSNTYIDRRLQYMTDYPLYVEDKKNPECLVGIEQVFDVVLTYHDGHQIRYVGTLDGLVQAVRKEGQPWFLEDNKTSLRLDDGWYNSWDMSHQVTGYSACSTAVFGFPVMRAKIVGSKIKPTGGADDFRIKDALERDGDKIQTWAAWVYDTERTYAKYENDFENAPTYTHSCNRYFRSCALLAFCCDSADGRKETYSEHMVDAALSPSELAASD